MKRILTTIFLLVSLTRLSAQKVDTTVVELWNGNAWVDSLRTVNSYDAGCGLISVLGQVWNEGSATWSNQTLTTYSYTGGKVSVILAQTWSNVSVTMVLLKRSRNLVKPGKIMHGSLPFGQRILMMYMVTWQQNYWKHWIPI